MKKISLLPFLVCSFIIGITNTIAQNNKNGATLDSLAKAEEDGLLMFKFEPDYLASIEARKTDIREGIKIIDTMDISDRKRRKLIKQLFKSTPSKKDSKTRLVETKFEDSEN